MSQDQRDLALLVDNLAQRANDQAGREPDWAWEQLCDLGLAYIGLTEERGGSGGSLGDLLVVIRGLAHAGLATPIVEASTAAYVLGAVPVDGFATIAVERKRNLAPGPVTAEWSDIRFPDTAATLVIVSADVVLATALCQPGVTVVAGRDVADLPCGTVQFLQVPVAAVAEAPPAGEVSDRLAMARAAALIGTACAAYELTRDYVLTRQQFGAPLIEIPAVSTALAQMAVRIGFTDAAFEHALALCELSHCSSMRRSSAVAAARIAAAELASSVARTAHQLHGALGFTEEYRLHRFTRALWAWRDADEPERDLCIRLGREALTAGEAALWEEISA